MATPRSSETQLTVAVLKNYCHTTGTSRELKRDEDMEELASTCDTREEEPPSPPLSPVAAPETPAEINIQDFLSQLQLQNDELSPEEQEYAQEIAIKLREFGDEMDANLSQHNHLWLQFFPAITNPNQGIVHHFMENIRNMKDKINTRTVMKVLYLGYRLLTCASTALYQPEQSELVETMIVFLVEQVTSWVRDQGGWDEMFALHQERTRSQSTPALPQLLSPLYHNSTSPWTFTPPRNSTPPPFTCTPPLARGTFMRNWRSQSFSHPIPIRLVPSVPSNSYSLLEDISDESSSRRSSFGSLVTIGVGMFAVALATYLQS